MKQERAVKCMLMAAIAYNLKKLLKFRTRKVQTNTQVVRVNLQALFLHKTSLTIPIYFLLAPVYIKQNW
jgi:hypothetical protein